MVLPVGSLIKGGKHCRGLEGAVLTISQLFMLLHLSWILIKGAWNPRQIVLVCLSFQVKKLRKRENMAGSFSYAVVPQLFSTMVHMKAFAAHQFDQMGSPHSLRKLTFRQIVDLPTCSFLNSNQKLRETSFCSWTVPFWLTVSFQKEYGLPFK